jgi:hypothetical protein
MEAGTAETRRAKGAGRGSVRSTTARCRAAADAQLIEVRLPERLMPYLPYPPRNFREIVLADLLRAQRLKLRVQDEIDPQFRIASPDGDWWIGMTLDADLAKREKQMQLVSRFIRWKLSPAFTLASEIMSPDAVYCIGVSHHECHAALSRIVRNPLRFGEIEWLTRAQIDDAYVALLPRGEATLDARSIAELDEWFGPKGKFPAVRMSNR